MNVISRRSLLAGAACVLAGVTACSPAHQGDTALSSATDVLTSSPQVPDSVANGSTSAVPQPAADIVIDAASRLRPISPLIYGLADASEALQQQVRPTLSRCGGNPNSRYNWRLGNAWNAARDYEFRNGNYGNTSTEDRQPSGVADLTIAANRTAGITSLLTIPALGWVAKDDNQNSQSLNVPNAGGAPIGTAKDAIAGYDPAANRARTSVPSLATASAGAAAGTVFQDDWVRHLVQRFGDAGHGGVQYYAIDNEPDLWGETHTDVHPVRPGYDAMLATFLDYATAIKQVDPNALVTGPVLSGWLSLFYSALDRGTDAYHSAPDHKAHGGVAFLPWWLQQVRQHDVKQGKRTLDVLDVHYYPQGGEYQPGGTDAVTNARRLRSTRGLWDPTYVEESWIANTSDDQGKRGIVRLIPRLRDWITAFYPGTKIAITEWNWGADDTANGALAIAEVLGIFGREGVDLAAYWTAPKESSPGALAFQAYRNYDGKGGEFGDTALATTVADSARLSCFASLDSKTGDVLAVVLNKDPAQPIHAGIRVANATLGATVQGVQYAGGGSVALTPLADVHSENGNLAVQLPPTSITVLRLMRG